MKEWAEKDGEMAAHTALHIQGKKVKSSPDHKGLTEFVHWWIS